MERKEKQDGVMDDEKEGGGQRRSFQDRRSSIGGDKDGVDPPVRPEWCCLSENSSEAGNTVGIGKVRSQPATGLIGEEKGAIRGCPSGRFGQTRTGRGIKTKGSRTSF